MIRIITLTVILILVVAALSWGIYAAANKNYNTSQDETSTESTEEKSSASVEVEEEVKVEKTMVDDNESVDDVYVPDIAYDIFEVANMSYSLNEALDELREKGYIIKQNEIVDNTYCINDPQSQMNVCFITAEDRIIRTINLNIAKPRERNPRKVLNALGANIACNTGNCFTIIGDDEKFKVIVESDEYILNFQYAFKRIGDL